MRLRVATFSGLRPCSLCGSQAAGAGRLLHATGDALGVTLSLCRACVCDLIELLGGAVK